MSLTPATAPARVCAGLDWASVDHAVCILDAEGTVLERFFVVHDAAGLKQLVRRLLKAGWTRSASNAATGLSSTRSCKPG